MSEKITVTINDDGTTKVEVEGVKGSGCEALTANLVKALGGGTTKKTAEHHQHKASHNAQAKQSS